MYGIFLFYALTLEVQLFRDKLFEVYPGPRRSFICAARVQGTDEFTESYADSMNIKFYLAGIVAAR